MASINDLDNPLLLLILNRLCIQKLFTAGHVCVRWNAMRDMSVSERKELILMVGNDAKDYIDDSRLGIPEESKAVLVDDNGDAMFLDKKDVQLQIHSFPLDFVRLLSTHFINLTTLTISSQAYSKVLDSIIHFLEQFNRPNGTLQTLKLYSNWDFSDENLDFTCKIRSIRTNLRLLSAVNSIGSLRKLVFDVNALFVKNENYSRIDLPILAQLEQFEFRSDDEFSCLHDSISRYAVNNQGLRRIGIQFQTDDFTWLLALSTELSSRFTQLNIELNDLNRNRFADICHHFSNITSLVITVDGFNSNIIQLRALTILTNLISLTVITSYIAPLSPARREMMNFELPSVKVFTINIRDRTRSHNFFHYCNLNRLFPNVQVVRVFLCGACCHYCNDKFDQSTRTDAISMALEEHCARYIFRHFTHSQHLRMVCTEVWGPYRIGPRCRKWDWGEMEPFEEEEDVDDVVEEEEQDTEDEEDEEE